MRSVSRDMSRPRIQLQARMGSTRLPGKALLPLNHARIVESVYHSVHLSLAKTHTSVA